MKQFVKHGQFLGKLIVLVCLVLLQGRSALGQGDLQVFEAELAVAFGSIPGRLVTVGEYLLFLDDEKAASSFAIRQSAIENLKSEEEVVSLATLQPVQDRSGARTRLSFRLNGEKDAQALLDWYSSKFPSTGEIVTKSTDGKAYEGKSYEVRHDHFLTGGCRGRLIVTADSVKYESIDDLSHSRRWTLKRIKGMEHPNPYRLEIDVFSGDDYNFEILGSGMESQEFTELVDRVTSARASRQIP